MIQLKQLFLLLTVLVWATLIGGIMYSHVAVMPSFLHQLPHSAGLLNSEVGVNDESFWMSIHPLAILLTAATLVFHWKQKPQRKLILGSLIIYLVVIVITAFYFVPELLIFANSGNDSSLSAEGWQQRGLRWEHLSWVRGFFMNIAFVLLLLTLAKAQSRITAKV